LEIKDDFRYIRRILVNKKIAYAIPNAFTAASLVCALIALNQTAEGSFIQAGWFITLSILFDGLDGRMARIFHATSKIGAQADSLADFVAFGIVPGFLAWQVGLKHFGTVGFVVFIFYVLCGGFRLARFNVMSANAAKKEDFTGLPIPAAAATVTSFILFNEVLLGDFSGNLIILIIMSLMGLLMVSKIPYIAVTKSHKNKKTTSLIIVAITTRAVLAIKHTIWVYLVCSWIYIFYGLYNQTRIYIKRYGEKHVYAKNKKRL
jgi:CDP-diacylglycerol--serine O-phosphatidyltransferase